jgi:hypothetical protein
MFVSKTGEKRKEAITLNPQWNKLLKSGLYLKPQCMASSGTPCFWGAFPAS